MYSKPNADACGATIRLAEPCDAAAIAVTLQVAFAEFQQLYTPAAFSETTPAANQIAERFAEGPIWIAELGDTVVGTISAVPHGLELYIRSMAVRPAARGFSIGTRLLGTVEAFAANHQYRRLLLNTTPFLVSAVHLYESHGFRYTGERSRIFSAPRSSRWPRTSRGKLRLFKLAGVLVRFNHIARCIVSAGQLF